MTTRHYWKSLDDSGKAPVSDGMPTNAQYRVIRSIGDSPEPDPMDRRTFLKAAGFSAAALAVVSCGRAPLKHIIPSTSQSEETIPGTAAWYASLCGGCEAGCGILVKNRDGRPIKIEGNPEHPLSQGGLCAAGQAMILSLYDQERLRAPTLLGRRATWPEVDAHIAKALSQAASDGRAVRLLTRSVSSPTAEAVIDSFRTHFPATRHLSYDPLSVSAILTAHEATHGARVLPRYRFERAEVIVTFEADFLGAWIAPVEYAAGYRAGRDLGATPHLSWHAQFESRLSLTGSKADLRVPVSPTRLHDLLARIASDISSSLGGPRMPSHGDLGDVPASTIEAVVAKLLGARGRSLVLCGVNDPGLQSLVNAINALLGNYGATLDIAAPSRQKRGRDADPLDLLDAMEAGDVGVLFIHGVNPVHDHPLGARFAAALDRVSCVVSFAERADETAGRAHVIAPDHHPLEAWRDAEPVAGVATMGQPVMAPLGRTRGFIESLAAWMGNPATELEIIRDHWRTSLYPRRTESALSFEEFWDRSVHDGAALLTAPPSAAGAFRATGIARFPVTAFETSSNAFALTLYAKVALPDSRHAHNPWLLELPDPITKVVWDNYITLADADARRIGVGEGDIVRVASGETALELPVFIQPGQAAGTAAIALGYGREGTDRFALVGPRWIFAKPTVDAGRLVGVNAAPLLSVAGGHVLARRAVSITGTGRRRELASTQRHHVLALRNALDMEDTHPSQIVEETTFAAFLADPRAGGHGDNPTATLWPDDHRYDGGPRWGMVVDLTACTGCSACVVGCQAENNIPVVGRDEAARGRIMHWLRLDRYYTGDAASPEVVHQPMTCHHCHNAPCEVVCPALATVHSADGLNQQVYNRCIGTRYCANNCPYKVRRFNWFDYPHEDRLRNMQLNPDVTVRTRGVMEKCTFCVQRIAAAGAEAKRRGQQIKDGEIRPACAQSCPSRAILFGDMNDPKSAVARAMADPRRYVALGELNLRPGLAYLRLVRNRDV